MSAPALKSKQYWGQPLRQALLFRKTPDMQVSYAVDKATTVDNTTTNALVYPRPTPARGDSTCTLSLLPACCTS
jgi:hypothetical protein